MSYFNHSFQKVFWGAGAVGYLNTASIKSVNLQSTGGVGAFTFADHTAIGWPSVATAPSDGKPLTLLATSLYQNDKIGPFHGGYQETTKSKMINPKFIHKFYRVDPVPALSNVIGIGSTPNLSSLTGCCPTFYCDETYSLRLDMKGSPALKFMNRNMYHVLDHYTGCCTAGATVSVVDPASVMIGWAKQLNNEPFWSGSYGQTDQRFVNVGVTSTCDSGSTWDLYLPDNADSLTAGLYFEADGTTLTVAGQAFADSVTDSVGGEVVSFDAATLVGGTGYTTGTGVATTGGSGTGLTVDITAGGGIISAIVLDAAGAGYKPGDIITVSTGGANATIMIDDVDLFTTVKPFSAYTSTFTPEAPNCCAGLVLEAAFVDTKFLDCSFDKSDNYEIEPLTISASMVDFNGDACTFKQLCISDGLTPSGTSTSTVYPAIRKGKQVQGTGESILRQLILSERYQQNHFATDIRLREVTQGNDVLSAVDRNELYTTYFIEHVVPRYNNASGVFDDDRYLLMIPVKGVSAPFEAFMSAWLAGANNPTALEIY